MIYARILFMISFWFDVSIENSLISTFNLILEIEDTLFFSLEAMLSIILEQISQFIQLKFKLKPKFSTQNRYTLTMSVMQNCYSFLEFRKKKTCRHMSSGKMYRSSEKCRVLPCLVESFIQMCTIWLMQHNSILNAKTLVCMHFWQNEHVHCTS